MANTRHPIHLVAGIAAASDPLRSQGQLVEWGRAGKPRAPSLFQLIRAFLGRARRDPAFRFFLDHPANLKPFWDAHPEERPRLIELRDAGRFGFACGLHRPIDSTCASLELMVRTAAHGLIYLEDYLGIPQHTFWHEIEGPFDATLLSVLAACGVEAGLIAAPAGASNGSAPGAHPPLRRRWLAPDGAVVPVWQAEQIGRCYRALQRPGSASARARLLLEHAGAAATPDTRGLLPLVAPWAPPLPKLEGLLGALEPEDPEVRLSLPLSLLPDDSEEEAPLTSVIPRFPSRTGETSLPGGGRAHRSASDSLQRAETLATWASLAGEPYPASRIDHGWRSLMAGARRDALAGRVNDQHRIDLLGLWRSVRDGADAIATEAGRALAKRIDTRRPRAAGKAGLPLVVFNLLSWPRRTIAQLRVPFAWLPAEGLTLIAGDGEELPFEVVPVTAGECRLRFLTPELPPMGHDCVHLVPGSQRTGLDIEESRLEVVTVQTAHHRLTIDPAWGGGIKTLRNRALCLDLLDGRQPGNELVVYPAGMDRRDGPGSRAFPARVYRRRSPLGTTLSIVGAFERGWRRQEIRLYDALPRIDFRTELYGYDKRDRTVTIELPFESAGRVPVAGRAVGADGHPLPVGRLWEEIEANRWAGWSSPVVVRSGEGARARERVIARVAVVAPAHLTALAESLVQALRPHGVTAAIVRPERDMPEDADLRVVLGAPQDNPFAGRLLESAHPSIPPLLADRRNASVWIDPPGQQPALLLWAHGKPLEQLAAKQVRLLEKAGRFEADILDPTFDRSAPAHSSIAVANTGHARYRFAADGTLALELCHLAEGGPVGHWPEPPARRGPEGRPFGLGSEPRVLDYSLHAGAGDWRQAQITRAVLDAQCPPWVVPAEPGPGPMARRESYLELESPGAIVTSVKRPGHAGVDRLLGRPLRRRDEVIVRLAEMHGRHESAKLKLPAVAESATWTDPTERLPLESSTGKRQLTFELSPHEIATLRLKLSKGLGDSRRAGGAEPVSAAGETTAWWRSHPGAEPESFLPVSLLIQPAVWASDVPDPGEVVVRVVSNRAAGEATGRLVINGPSNWKLRGAPRKEITLAAGGERAWRIHFEPERDDGLWWLHARWVPEADGAPVDAFARVLIGKAPPDDSPIAFRWCSGEADLFPGEAATLVGELENRTSVELSVVAEAIAPFDLWSHLGPRQQIVTLAPGECRSLHLDVELPENALAGQWWTLFKLTAAGEATYSEAARIGIAT